MHILVRKQLNLLKKNIGFHNNFGNLSKNCFKTNTVVTFLGLNINRFKEVLHCCC